MLAGWAQLKVHFGVDFGILAIVTACFWIKSGYIMEKALTQTSCSSHVNFETLRERSSTWRYAWLFIDAQSKSLRAIRGPS